MCMTKAVQSGDSVFLSVRWQRKESLSWARLAAVTDLSQQQSIIIMLYIYIFLTNASKSSAYVEMIMQQFTIIKHGLLLLLNTSSTKSCVCIRFSQRTCFSNGTFVQKEHMIYFHSLVHDRKNCALVGLEFYKHFKCSVFYPRSLNEVGYLISRLTCTRLMKAVAPGRSRGDEGSINLFWWVFCKLQQYNLWLFVTFPDSICLVPHL